MMKILGISCSPRKKGNTDILIEQALDGATKEGAIPIFMSIRDLSISGCDGCYSCAKSGKCHIDDDMHTIYRALEESQGIIFGSPIYFWSVCGQAKVMIDRTIALRFPHQRLENKIGGIILVATRRGCMNASGFLTHWMLSNHMLLADVVDGYATEKGAVGKDFHAMKAAFELGRLMVKLIEKGFTYPEEFNHPIYRMIQKKYEIDPCPVS
jgi:multimeric flavodoxin WrbA